MRPFQPSIASFLLLMGCICAASPAKGAREAVLVRIDGVTPEIIPLLEEAGFDLTREASGSVDALTTQEGLAWLSSRNFRWTRIERDLAPGAAGRGREGNLDPLYHTYDEMVGELLELEAQYPSICRVYDIGDALSKMYFFTNFHHQYDIWAIRISDNPSTEEAEPCIVYDARHHAREPVSTEIVMALASHLCRNYSSDPLIRQIVNSSEIWCVPMLNPDGHQWVEDVDIWWRKTLYDADQDHSVDPYEGIDPNRNYDWHWSGGYWNSETYGGPYPWSAPEVVSVRGLHAAQRPAINPSFHSYGEVVLYPFGYGVQPEPAVVEIASEYGSAIGYDVEQSYNPAGTSKDWLYGTIGTVSFTVETATEFIPTGATMQSVVEKVLPGSIWLARRLWGASIQGRVTSAATGLPLTASIRIPEIHDVYGQGELWDMVTEAATGYYCRMMPVAQQTITLEVVAEGHLPATLQVVTGGSNATICDISLLPVSSAVSGMEITGSGAPIRFMNPYRPGETILLERPLASAPRGLIVIDLQGRVVRRLTFGGFGRPADETSWDGRDQFGAAVPDGIYFMRGDGGDPDPPRAKIVLRR